MTEQTSYSEAETVEIGRAFARDLRAGDVVLLQGPLGAGKTAFVRGLAEGLGCDLEGVSSPTFTIVQEYAGAIRLQHVDLYRLSPVEVDDLGLDDLLEGAVMAIEWPDRWRRAPASARVVTLEPMGDMTRRISINSAQKFPCPCCGSPTLDARGKNDICPVCKWQDDGQGDDHADEIWGGPNGDLSLTQARHNFRTLGISDPSLRK